MSKSKEKAAGVIPGRMMHYKNGDYEFLPYNNGGGEPRYRDLLSTDDGQGVLKEGNQFLKLEIKIDKAKSQWLPSEHFRQVFAELVNKIEKSDYDIMCNNL